MSGAGGKPSSRRGGGGNEEPPVILKQQGKDQMIKCYLEMTFQNEEKQPSARFGAGEKKSCRREFED